MNDVVQQLLIDFKPRNFVAKNNHNRCQRMRIRTKYQRNQKHKYHTKFFEV
jgi:hypothetical protein